MSTANPAPAPLLILTPMRSFSSVVCAMLGQHPQMYGLPEVNLFIADTVDELLDIHRPRPHGLHGLLRTLAQLHDGEQTEATVDKARAWLKKHGKWSTAKVFQHITREVAPKIAVDKTPRTVLRPEYLQRALVAFPQANFLHLTRHPRSTGKSLLANVSKNEDWGGTFRPEWLDPEKIWVKAHQNIVDFAATLPLGQCMRIRGEDLLAEPDTYLPQITEWLGVSRSARALSAMLHPERSVYACPGPDNARLGNDPDFLENPQMRPGRAVEPPLAGELDWAPGKTFGKQTLKLARMFGYA